MPMVNKSEMVYLREKMDEQGKLISEIHGTVLVINQRVKTQNGAVKDLKKKVDKHDTSIDKAQGAIDGLKIFGVVITLAVGIIALLAYFKPM